MNADLLFELGTEELPPQALRRLSTDLGDIVRAELDALELQYGALHRYATPRRLALHIAELETRQPDQIVERRGPAVGVSFDAQGHPTKAAQGFARSCGTSVDALERLASDKGEWLLFRSKTPGALTAELLPSVLSKAVHMLPVPKRMRWGDLDESFVRPVHWIVALFGEQVLDLELFGVRAGRATRGHRFHCPQPIVLKASGDYDSMLADSGYVVADFEQRRDRVREQVMAEAEAVGGVALVRDALLDEVAALVEWPVALSGRFETRFLTLPREVLTATLEEHQRYFPVSDSSGALMPAFIAVANLESVDPEQVRAGNERVVRPRLADALFFWEQDLKQPLEAYTPHLNHVAFQHDLGSLADKTHRIETLAAWLAEISGVSTERVSRAAHLAKADLLTSMVYEFTELQGTMGRYYALASGEDPEVAAALEEQYWPRQAGDALPRTSTGCMLALADRIDTIAGIFAIGQRPTGEKDPFGLRRAALGLVRILVERQLDLDLRALVAKALALQPVTGSDNRESIEDGVYTFVFERMRSYYAAMGVPVEVFSAVEATDTTRPLDFARRIAAVQHFLNLPQAAQLAAAHKRIRNILKQATGVFELEPTALHEAAEVALYEQLRSLDSSIDALLDDGDYARVLTELAHLQAPVDRFFDNVMVMSEDAKERANRIALLERLDRLCRAAADLSYLPG